MDPERIAYGKVETYCVATGFSKNAVAESVSYAVNGQEKRLKAKEDTKVNESVDEGEMTRERFQAVNTLHIGRQRESP